MDNSSSTATSARLPMSTISGQRLAERPRSSTTSTLSRVPPSASLGAALTFGQDRERRRPPLERDDPGDLTRIVVERSRSSAAARNGSPHQVVADRSRIIWLWLV